MITLAPGYVGFKNVSLALKEKMGGLGESTLKELFVFGSDKYEAHITFSSSIPHGQHLEWFFTKKLGLAVQIKTNPNIANKYWLSLARVVREDSPEVAAKIIIMVYSTLNELVVW
jgi:hypothetical protein